MSLLDFSTITIQKQMYISQTWITITKYSAQIAYNEKWLIYPHSFEGSRVRNFHQLNSDEGSMADID